MKILYYVGICGGYMAEWQRIHILGELGVRGVEFEEFNPEGYENPEKAIFALSTLLKQHHFDLFMTGYGQKYVSLDLLAELRHHGIPSLLFCADNLLVPFEHLEISSHFDLVWLTAHETEYLFKRRGAKTIFLPYAANPDIYRGPCAESTNRALFIGSPYGSRANIINALATSGVDVDLYGGDLVGAPLSRNKTPLLAKKIKQIRSISNYLRFPVGQQVLMGAIKQKISGTSGVVQSANVHLHAGLSFNDMYEAYGKYAVSLASTAARNTGILKKPVNVINLRSFEIPMSGGVQLCAYSDELAEYFEDGQEIVFYRNQDELVEKACYLISDRAVSDVGRIRRHARDRSLRDHTWTNRFNKVLSRLGMRQLAAQK